MRYKLTAGRVLIRGDFAPMGSVHDLSDDEAARWRLGGCTLEPMQAAKPEPKPAPAADDAPAPVKPKRRGRPRKSRPAQPDAAAEG